MEKKRYDVWDNYYFRIRTPVKVRVGMIKVEKIEEEMFSYNLISFSINSPIGLGKKNQFIKILYIV